MYIQQLKEFFPSVQHYFLGMISESKAFSDILLLMLSWVFSPFWCVILHYVKCLLWNDDGLHFTVYIHSIKCFVKVVT